MSKIIDIENFFKKETQEDNEHPTIKDIQINPENISDALDHYERVMQKFTEGFKATHKALAPVEADICNILNSLTNLCNDDKLLSQNFADADKIRLIDMVKEIKNNFDRFIDTYTSNCPNFYNMIHLHNFIGHAYIEELLKDEEVDKESLN